MAMLNSAARGWKCGVFNPHGPRNPTVIAIPLSTRAGNVSRFAETIRPSGPAAVTSSVVGLKKSKTKSVSFKRLMRSTAVAAVKRRATL